MLAAMRDTCRRANQDWGHRDNARPVPADLLDHSIDVFPRREADDLQPVGMGVDHGQRALSDGPRGAEDGNPFHDYTYFNTM